MQFSAAQIAALIQAKLEGDPDVTVNYHMGASPGKYAVQPIPVANDAKAILEVLQR